ncbi:hypothetical protein NMG60_11034046 [Bertholletia excelsa]
MIYNLESHHIGPRQNHQNLNNLSHQVRILGIVSTMFAALFSKLGVPIKTTVSTTILEEAPNGLVKFRPLPLGEPVSGKVEKECAHFYSVSIPEEEARSGLVCRVELSDKSKFKAMHIKWQKQVIMRCGKEERRGLTNVGGVRVWRGDGQPKSHG